MGLKKTFKKAGKSAKKAVKKTTKAVTNTAEDAWDTTTDIAEEAVDLAADVADMTVQAYNAMVDSVEGLSSTAARLAQDVVKELERVGDLALALLDDLFLAALEAFVDQLISDYAQALTELTNAVIAVAKDPSSVANIADAITSLTDTATDAAKDAFVMSTAPTQIPPAVAALQGIGFKSVSLGVQADASGGNTVGAAGGVAAKSSELVEGYTRMRGAEVTMRVYAGAGQGAGTGAGASTGVELGAWRDSLGDLEGPWIGVSVGASVKAGADVEVYVTEDISKFLGFNVVPQTGTSIEFSVTSGRTETGPAF